MPEEQQPDQPNEESTQGSTIGSSNVMDFEAKSRLTLQRKLSQSDEAQLLSEQIHISVHKRWYMRAVFRLSILFGIFFIGFSVIYFFVVPRFAEHLPGMLRPAVSKFSNYQRVVKMTMDYFPDPGAATPSPLARVFDHGVSFDIALSSRVGDDKNFEGTARIDIDTTKLIDPDADLGYRVLRTPNGKDFKAYFFVNSWPSQFSFIHPLQYPQGTWFGYDSEHPDPAEMPLKNLTVILKSTDTAAHQELMGVMWQHILSTNVLQWKLANLHHDDVHQAWTTDFKFALDAARLHSFVTSLQGDPAFDKAFIAAFPGEPSGDGFLKYLGDLQALSGTLTVGIKDGIIYGSNIDFSLNDAGVGMFQGTMIMSLNTLLAGEDLTAPQTNIDARTLFVPPGL